MKVIAVYYKMFDNRSSLIKFFETREEADKYLMNEYFGGETKDKYEIEYRKRQIKEKIEFKELSVVEILNELYQNARDVEDRLDYHSI